MDTREIPVAAIERNRAWIEAMTNALKTNGDLEFSRAAMRETGKQCAAQLLEKIVTHFGHTPQSIDEFIEAINKRRREVLQVSNLWQRDGNKAYFKLEKCGCDLVEAGLAMPNPIFCLCSAGMFTHLFAPFWKGIVTTQIVKAIGLGDECCEFVVHFDEEMPLKSGEIK
jgi:predicted hydrocarbon binding protein